MTAIMMSNISVKITDLESGVEYGRVSFDGLLDSYDCFRHFTDKVSCYPWRAVYFFQTN